VTAAPPGADAGAVRRAFLAQAEAAPDRYVVVPGELLDTGRAGGLVSPVVRRRLAALVATRYPAAGEGDPAPEEPTTPGATSTAAAERAGRSVG
jgi:dTMP kinase